MTIRLKCKNDTYKDFGSHTGFRYIDRKYDNLIVGKYYDFVVKGKMFIQKDKKYAINGEFFYINGQNHTDLYTFFYNICELRQIKFRKLKSHL